MKALSMYSGGCDGISLAASWAGIETVAYCDNDAACRALLQSRHPHTPIYESDEDVTISGLLDRGIDPNGIDIIFGGPPCQIASVAGKRLGAGDPRNRWPEFLRVIGDIRPRWIMAENVPGLLSAQGKSGIKGELFGDILSALAKVGYRVGWCCYGAADVGAPHKRERLFIVGYAEHDGQLAAEIAGSASPGNDSGTSGTVKPCESSGSGQQLGQLADTQGTGLSERDSVEGTATEHATQLERFGADVEHAGGTGRQERNAAAVTDGQRHVTRRPHEGRGAGATQPRVDGGADGLSEWLDCVARRLEIQRWPAGKGAEQYAWEPPRVARRVVEGECVIPDRAARIKMIGNSCPPQQYCVILAAIVATERMMNTKERDQL